MALPKEPRQKMINLMYLVLTALLALNVSSEILNAFKVVDTSLQNSSSNLAAANSTLYKSLSCLMT
jgi:Skp family chaperone for outer membrane proteins